MVPARNRLQVGNKNSEGSRFVPQLSLAAFDATQFRYYRAHDSI
jgi:hypothetical protein